MAKAKKQKANQAGSRPSKASKPSKAPAPSSACGQGPDAVRRVCEIVPAVLVGALVLFQGGYYAGATCVIALVSLVVLAVFAIMRKNAGLVPAGESARSGGSGGSGRSGGLPLPLPLPLAPLLIALIGMLHLASALVHGATATMLLECATWFAVAGMSLWCVRGSASSRTRMLDDLAAVGAVLAVSGILMFVGLLPFEGTVNAGRLMFTFQYANTAGLFFGVVAILCLCSSRKRYRLMALLPVIALGMTQSAGALAMFLVALIAVGVRYAVVEKPDRRLVLGAAVAGVAVFAAAIVLLQARLAQAAQTFVERIVQMLDALAVLGGNLVLGIGPDSWQFTYPTVQTAQYRAADVHCSYLQVALDGGVLAALVLVALIVVGVWVLVRMRDFRGVVCVLMIAAHAAFDFDFQFASIVVLLAMLVSVPDGALGGATGGAPAGASNGANGEKAAPVGRAVSSRARAAACWAVAACALAGCVVGVYLDTRMGEVQTACARGQADEAAALLESVPLLADDLSLRVQVVGALLAAGDYDAVLVEAQGYERTLGSIGLYRAISLSELGRSGEALDAFEQLLEDFPYDVDLYEAVRAYGEERTLGDEFAQMYNVRAAHANELAASGHAAWLGNQEQVGLID